MIKFTILIKGATRERLKHLGAKGETYDNLINRLLDQGKSANYRNRNMKSYEPAEEYEAFNER